MPGCIKPMSSPMMKRMLGLLCCWDCCCAQAGMLANENVVNATSRPLETYFDIMWGLPKLPYLPLVAAHEGVLLHDCSCAIALAQMMGLSLSCTVAHRYRVKWGYLRANSRDPIYITYTATLTSGEVAFKNAALTMQRDSLLLNASSCSLRRARGERRANEQPGDLMGCPNMRSEFCPMCNFLARAD